MWFAVTLVYRNIHIAANTIASIQLRESIYVFTRGE